MPRHPWIWFRCTAAVALFLWGPVSAAASDHTDAPGTSADPAADIGDLYAWHSDTKAVAVLTFAAGALPQNGQAGVYDPDVLYTVHLDRTGDRQSDLDIRIRFGQNARGEWGVQVENLPGSGDKISGAVNSLISAGGGRFVFAGLRDDPFFFDLEGFEAAVHHGRLSFDPTRDAFAGRNATAIVLEMDLNAAREGSNVLNLWATTGRK